MIRLPVSIGEALDKLSILEIKLIMITDERKQFVRDEYNLLYDQLKEFTRDPFYSLLKSVNMDIWFMMDIIRKDSSDEEYLVMCRKCIEANMVRFRIKNKLNETSSIKEQKGYPASVVNIVTDSDATELVRLASVYYDMVLVNDDTQKYKTILHDGHMSLNDHFKDLIYIIDHI